MNILVGEFVSETNENIPKMTRISDYVVAFGDDCIDYMDIKDLYDAEGVTLIPSIYANANSGGLITKETFDYIETSLLRAIKENLSKIDGIFLMLHGASKVEDIGSGDHHILKEVRKLVGDYMPIAVACDPHGNLTKEYVEATQIIRSYRHSPHTDATETLHIVSKMLIDLVRNRQHIHSVYRKLPLILGGEQSVSLDEPVLSINKYMDELEKDPRIKSASWHVGYLRHDCPEAGCGIVVVPETTEDQDYAEEVADKLAKYVWDKRHEFHYTGLTLSVDETIERLLAHEGDLAVTSDSGDNTTSGAGGWNTYLLRKFLAIEDLKKKVLFASICDPATWRILDAADIGDKKTISLGIGHDELSAPVELDVEVKAKGPIEGFMMHNLQGVTYGDTVVVHIEDTPIDIVVASTAYSFAEVHQFTTVGVDIHDYDIIVIKQGYIFPEMLEVSDLSIMCLTDGATLQDTKRLKYKQIMRPMYPIDEI